MDQIEKMISKCMEHNFDKQKREDSDELIDLANKMEELFLKQREKADKDAQLESHNYNSSYRE